VISTLIIIFTFQMSYSIEWELHSCALLLCKVGFQLRFGVPLGELMIMLELTCIPSARSDHQLCTSHRCTPLLPTFPTPYIRPQPAISAER
jgi:hypothetical protein